MNHFKMLLFLGFVCFSLPFTSIAQTMKVNFTPEEWEINAKKQEFVLYKGKQSLHLTTGKAQLKNSTFKNGIIDYNVAIEKGVNFAGIHFRVNDNNHEDFYLRPHQSGNPDATQYTPVINGSSGWQLYHGKGHSAAYNFNFEEWMHIRLIINEGKADVFINDMSQPFLHISDLKLSPTAGQIAFSSWVGSAYYANLTYQEIDNPPLVSKVTPLPSLAKEVIPKWQVSTAFADTLLNEIAYFSDFPLKKKLNWQTVPVEYTGTVNLARVSALSKASNMILVKAVIHSDKNQLKRLDFGYSDGAVVYLNEEAIYKGHNNFRSRDYRYLGSIGYFDAVFLPLQKGRNELIFAVSENMGGWGLKAKLANLEGVRIE